MFILPEYDYKYKVTKNACKKDIVYYSFFVAINNSKRSKKYKLLTLVYDWC